MKLRFVAKENQRVPGTILRALRQAGEVPISQRPTWRNPKRPASQTWITQLGESLGYSLKKLGQGSSRSVYAISDELVLKVARNEAGIAQNKAEYQAYAKLSDCSMITKIFYYQDNFQWLLVERVIRPAKDADFLMYSVGAPYNFVTPYDLAYYSFHDNSHGFLDPAFKKDYASLKRILKWHGGIDGLGELGSLRQWGIVERFRQQYPVLVDYGFNLKVYEIYY
jgi:hypothetical protein